MALLELIKDRLKEEDKGIFQQLDFRKSDDEIIFDMIRSNLLNFDCENTNDKKIS